MAALSQRAITVTTQNPSADRSSNRGLPGMQSHSARLHLHLWTAAAAPHLGAPQCTPCNDVSKTHDSNKYQRHIRRNIWSTTTQGEGSSQPQQHTLHRSRGRATGHPSFGARLELEKYRGRARRRVPVAGYCLGNCAHVSQVTVLHNAATWFDTSLQLDTTQSFLPA
jgi:hypothetical protein